MVETIEFEVTKPVTKKLTLLTLDMSDHSLKLMGLPPTHPTTPAEFDVVARKLDYVKREHLCGVSGWSEIGDVLLADRENSESPLETLRRLKSERCSGCRQCSERANNRVAAATSHTCLIDGVTYRGNEETIRALEYEQAAYTGASKSRDELLVPAIPEKWRKAIEPLADWEFIGTAHHDRIGYAINELGNACISESATTMHVRHATQQLLHWLCELEKGSPND